MGYFADYWGQIRSFYRSVWMSLFARERNLDGPLARFNMKEGFFWELMEMHVWLVRLVGRFFLTLFHILFAYLSLILIAAIMLVAPVFILLLFPLFVWKRRRNLKARGAAL